MPDCLKIYIVQILIEYQHFIFDVQQHDWLTDYYLSITIRKDHFLNIMKLYKI